MTKFAVYLYFIQVSFVRAQYSFVFILEYYIFFKPDFSFVLGNYNNIAVLILKPHCKASNVTHSTCLLVMLEPEAHVSTKSCFETKECIK